MIIILSFPFIFYALSCFVSGAVQVYIVIVIDYRCCYRVMPSRNLVLMQYTCDVYYSTYWR